MTRPKDAVKGGMGLPRWPDDGRPTNIRGTTRSERYRHCRLSRHCEGSAGLGIGTEVQGSR